MKVATRKPRQRFRGRLKFCSECSYVWETSSEGVCVRYGNMPTYGLPRITCKNCNKNLTKRKQYD